MGSAEEGKKKTHAFKIIEIIPLEICLIQVIVSKITIILIIFIKIKWQSHILGIILILLQETNLLNPK